jgi:NADPH:quinone reductase-like Zn-dependent oxidoreductase
MRALTHQPGRGRGLRFAEVQDPRPAVDEALVEVTARSLDHLDVAYRAERLQAGQVPGVDAAGTVVAAAADGSGPQLGDRVVGFGRGT